VRTLVVAMAAVFTRCETTLFTLATEAAAVRAKARATQFVVVTVAVAAGHRAVAERLLGPGLHLGFHARDHGFRDAVGREALDATHHRHVTALGQGHGQAGAAGTTRTTDAVHVVLGLHRHAVVDHVGDRGHVD